MRRSYTWTDILFEGRGMGKLQINVRHNCLLIVRYVFSKSPTSQWWEQTLIFAITRINSVNSSRDETESSIQTT